MAGISLADLDKRLSELEESHKVRTRSLSAQSIANQTLLRVLWSAMTKTDESEVNQAALDAIEDQFQRHIDEAENLTTADREFLEMCKEEARSFFTS